MKYQFLSKRNQAMRLEARKVLTTFQFLSDFTEIMEFSGHGDLLAVAGDLTDWFGTTVLIFSDQSLYAACEIDMRLGLRKIHRILIDGEIVPPDDFILEVLGQADALIFIDVASDVIRKVRTLCASSPNAFSGHTVVELTTGLDTV